MREKRSLNEWIIIGVLSLVIIQIIGLILTSIFQFPLYLGPGFLLISVAASVLLAFVFTINLLNGQPMKKTDILAMVIVFIITITAVIFLRRFIPEIFVPATQSMISFITP